MSDLTSSFGTPAVALGGLLPPKKAAKPQLPAEEAVQPASSAEPVAAPEPTQNAKVEPRPSAPAFAGAGDEPISTQVSVYLTPTARAAARKARGHRSRQTNAEVAFDAIDATIDQLPALLAARRTGPPRPGSLFPARQRLPRGGDVAERRVLWSMNATEEELAIVDRLVDRTGATSRSELIATAIESHLTRPRRRR